MRHSRFYTDQSLNTGQSISITDSRAHYIRNVLRLKSGDSLTLFNGQGGEYEAQIADVKKHEVSVDVLKFESNSRSAELKIILGISLIKREAMDAAIQKATELGVHIIQPLLSQNTSVSSKGMDKRLRHWHEISINACEQCGLNIPPNISNPIQVEGWFTEPADLKLIACPRATNSATNEKDSKQESEKSVTPNTIMLAVGPEGGFSEEEVHTALNLGFESLSLGPRILRADTAVSTLMSLTQFRWGDLR